MDKRDAASVYTQYCSKVMGFVRSKVVNRADAEDIVQSVFLKVCGNLDRFDEKKASLSTWIYTITRNTVYDYLREKRDRPLAELPDNAEASDSAPDASMLSRETLEELAAALEKLPQAQRDAVILLYYKALDRKTVCEMLGLTYGQLRYLHDKALERLEALLHTK